MFWRKKNRPRVVLQDVQPPAPPPPNHNEIAEQLARKLSEYSTQAYNAEKRQPDPDAAEAHKTVRRANDFVRSSRVGVALCRTIIEHIYHFPSWIERDDFSRWLGFHAVNLTAKQLPSEDEEEAKEIAFEFSDTPYRIQWGAPKNWPVMGDTKYGWVKLFHYNRLVADFEISNKLSSDYSFWQFHSVKALHVGEWMKHVLEMAAQIENHDALGIKDSIEQEALEAAKNITFGDDDDR